MTKIKIAGEPLREAAEAMYDNFGLLDDFPLEFRDVVVNLYYRFSLWLHHKEDSVAITKYLIQNSVNTSRSMTEIIELSVLDMSMIEVIPEIINSMREMCENGDDS